MIAANTWHSFNIGHPRYFSFFKNRKQIKIRFHLCDNFFELLIRQFKFYEDDEHAQFNLQRNMLSYLIDPFIINTKKMYI
jgi:hypothetical protein